MNIKSKNHTFLEVVIAVVVVLLTVSITWYLTINSGSITKSENSDILQQDNADESKLSPTE